MVFGLRLADGRDVVVKARADDGRAVSCVAAQARLAERGFPCARPLTPVAGIGSLAVHAEEFRPGGEVLHGDSPDVAVRYAEVFAWLMAELAGVTVAPPLPNPRWVRWDHAGSGMWPAIDFLDTRDQSVVPAHVVEAAERARGRLLAAALPCVLATPTSRRRISGGTAGRWERCTTGTAWRGNRRRRWRERRAGRSPAPGRPRWRRSKAPRRSWRLIRTFGSACSRPELEHGVPSSAAAVRRATNGCACAWSIPHEIKRSPARCGPARWCACGRCSARSSAAVHPAGRPRRVLRSPRPLRSARRRRSGR